MKNKHAPVGYRGEDCVTPYYSTQELSRNGETYGCIIESFVVPSHQRGQGLGNKLYEKFESELSDSMKIVGLIAADLGSGPTNDFWASRGFVPAFDYSQATDDEKRWMYFCMVKGVNGTPTPQPLPLSDYDEPFFPEPPIIESNVSEKKTARAKTRRP